MMFFYPFLCWPFVSPNDDDDVFLSLPVMAFCVN
jgi:hypothetical protein